MVTVLFMKRGKRKEKQFLACLKLLFPFPFFPFSLPDKVYLLGKIYAANCDDKSFAQPAGNKIFRYSQHFWY